MDVPGLDEVKGSEEIIISRTREDEVIELDGGIQRRRCFVRIIVLKYRGDIGGGKTATIAAIDKRGSKSLSSIIWREQKPFTVAPSNLHFGVIQKGEKKSIKAILTFKDELNVEIMKILNAQTEDYTTFCTAMQINEDDKILSRQKAMFELTLTTELLGDMNRSAISGEIEILTNSKRSPKISLPFSAFVGKNVQ